MSLLIGSCTVTLRDSQRISCKVRAGLVLAQVEQLRSPGCSALCPLPSREVTEAVDLAAKQKATCKPEDFQERQVRYNKDLIFSHPTLPFFIFPNLRFVTQLLIPFL